MRQWTFKQRAITAAAVGVVAVAAAGAVVIQASAAPAQDPCATVRDQVAANEAVYDAATAAGGLTSAQRTRITELRAIDAAALRHCPPPSSTPSATSSPSASPSPSAVATSSPTPTPTSTNGARACPALPAFPTAACTGNITPEDSLAVTNGGMTVSVAGTHIDKQLITGQLTIAAPNVVITDSVIYHGITNCCVAGSSYTVTDTTVGPTSGCDTGQAVGVNSYSALRVHVRNFGDGFRDSGNNIDVEDSFVTTCAPAGSGAHSDGMQAYEGGLNVKINHSTIDLRADDLCCLTAALFSANASNGWTMTNNLVMGGGYTIQLENTDFSGGYLVDGNRIVTNAWQYGPNLIRPTCTGVNWGVDNRLVTIDASYNVTSVGASIGCP